MGGVVLDQRQIFWSERERIKENKETRFVFLIEEERRAEAENDTTNIEVQHEAEARRARESETG